MGVLWTALANPGDTERRWATISASADGQTIIAGVRGGRLYLSTDRWVTRSEVQPAGAVDLVWRASAMSADGQTIIVSASSACYLSTDGGDTWSPVTEPAGARSLAMSHDGQVIVSASSYAYRSEDGGSTWSNRECYANTRPSA